MWLSKMTSVSPAGDTSVACSPQALPWCPVGMWYRHSCPPLSLLSQSTSDSTMAAEAIRENHTLFCLCPWDTFCVQQGQASSIHVRCCQKRCMICNKKTCKMQVCRGSADVQNSNRCNMLHRTGLLHTDYGWLMTHQG